MTEPPLRPEQPFYYGWVMLPVASLMVVGTLPGQTVVASQFNSAIRESLGLSLGALSSAYLIGTLCASVPLTLVGRVSDRIGPRLTAAFVVGALCLGILYLSRAESFIELTLGFFLIRFFGQGALGMLSSHALALWFERRLATVESVKHGCMSIAGAASPALVLWLISGYGWRQAYAILGVVVAAVLLPLIAFVFRNRPEEIGQHLDNEPPDHHRRWHDEHARRTAPPEVVCFTLGETLRTRAFWLLLFPGMLSGTVGTAMLFHIQPMLEAAGASDPKAGGAAAVSAWSIAMFVGLVLGGPLADRFPVRALLPVSAVGTGLSALVMSTMGEAWLATVSMGVFGFGASIGMASAGPAIARFFGRPHHGAIRGFVTTAMVAGTATGPYLLAIAAELAGGRFRPGLIGFALVAFPIAVGASFVKRPPLPNDRSEILSGAE